MVSFLYYDLYGLNAETWQPSDKIGGRGVVVERRPCDQIGHFESSLVSNLLTIVAQIFGDILGYFK